MDCPECRPSVTWWRVFDTSPFMSRSDCGNWPTWLQAMWVTESAGLFVLYVGIAAALFATWHRAQGTKIPRWSLVWLGFMFLGCAGGHAVNALAFRWPIYVAAVYWDAFTLAVSVVAAYGVWVFWKWATNQLDEIKRLEVEADVREAKIAQLLATAESFGHPVAVFAQPKGGA